MLRYGSTAEMRQRITGTSSRYGALSQSAWQNVDYGYTLPSTLADAEFQYLTRCQRRKMSD